MSKGVEDSHELNSRDLILILHQKPISRPDIFSSHSAQIWHAQLWFVYLREKRPGFLNRTTHIHVTKSITLYEGLCACDVGVIKPATKCKYATALLFIQLTKKINHKKSPCLKTGKVCSHLLTVESRRKNRVVEWRGRSCPSKGSRICNLKICHFGMWIFLSWRQDPTDCRKTFTSPLTT